MYAEAYKVPESSNVASPQTLPNTPQVAFVSNEDDLTKFLETTSTGRGPAAAFNFKNFVFHFLGELWY